MFHVFDNISIEGIASAVPSKIENNKEASKILGERRCYKQIKLTGIQERRISPKYQRISDLCYVAARELLNNLKWDAKDIKLLILLTQHPDFRIPSTAFYIQKILNIEDNSMVFDVNMGCSAFNVGLQIVSSLLQQMPNGSKALCMQGDLAYDVISEDINPDDVASMMLFGSGVSVIALEKKTKASEIYCQTYSLGDKYDAIIRPHNQNVRMDGTGVFNFSTNYVVEKLKQFMCHINVSDIDYYVFHQAQKLILDSIITELKIPTSKELRSLEKYGNTSGASIPISICSNKEILKNKTNINLLTCGFGVGLSCSMGYFSVNTKNILPIIITDYVYEDR